MEENDLSQFNDWESDEDEEVVVKSLFDETLHPGILQALEHDRARWDFNMHEAATSVGMGDLSLIMLVNFVRCRVTSVGYSGVTPEFVAKLKIEVAERKFLDDEKYMVPVLQGDPLLYLLQDALGMGSHSDEDDDDNSTKVKGGIELESGATIDALKLEITKFKTVIGALTAEPSAGANEKSENATAQCDDSYYFDSYSQVAIHETMLRDAPRTGSYAAALATPGFLSGKIVLDVGCGTGILCMLAAKSGAKKVIGVDMSSMIEQSRNIVERNGLSNAVTLVRGRMEEITLPEGIEEVDVIVSEWMGYGLYFENMVSSVLHARKEYLAPGGIMMPSHALLYVEALSARGSEDRVGWWKDVYGFDMSPCSAMLTHEAQVQLVSSNDVCSRRALLHTLDMLTAEDDDLDFSATFSLEITRDGPINAIVVSFDVEFRLGSGRTDDDKSPFVTLSTAAQSPDTHWKQTVLWLQAERVEQWKTGDLLNGSLEYRRRTSNFRDYDLVLSWNGKTGEALTQIFVLA